MLYLPPGVAHRGTAVGPGCMTWSIGFRAPNRVCLADSVWANHVDGLSDSDWSDPWLQATDKPGQIPEKLLKAFTKQVEQSLPGKAAIERGVACVLSEPAPAAIFEPPGKPDSFAVFCKKIAKTGLRLAPASRLLYFQGRFFFNGEEVDLGLPKPKGAGNRDLEQLADSRALPPAVCAKLSTALKNFVYQAFLSGQIRYDLLR